MEDNMQKMIWIPNDLVEGIKEAAYNERKSVSQYLVDLHREKVDSKLMDNFSSKIQIEDYNGKPIYTETYRRHNPMELCSTCGKALKFNCGH